MINLYINKKYKAKISINQTASRLPIDYVNIYIPFVSWITIELYSRNVTNKLVGWLAGSMDVGEFSNWFTEDRK